MIVARLAGRSLIGRQPRRRITAYVLVFLSGFTSGCYTYGPAAPNPTPGTHVLLEVNDKGRVGLGNSIGPTSQSIEGTVESFSDSAVALKVEKVVYLNGQENAWNGESLVISRDFIGNTKERSFSQGKSLLLGAGVVAAVVAFVLSRQLLGSGNEPATGPPPPPKGN